MNKKRLYESLSQNKDRVYNFIARQVIDRIPFEKCTDNAIDLIVDKSKGKPEIVNFNDYIKNQLEAKIKPNIPINIRHLKSHENHGLQACDMFCYGIFLDHEREKSEWRNIFSEKIIYEEIYLG